MARLKALVKCAWEALNLAAHADLGRAVEIEPAEAAAAAE
jgi:hypothetical protein